MKRMYANSSTCADKLAFRRRRRLLPNCKLSNSSGKKTPLATAFHILEVTPNIPNDTIVPSDIQLDTAANHTEEIPPLQLNQNPELEYEEMWDAIAIEEQKDDDEELQTSRCLTLLPWSKLFSLLCICGSVRLTADQHALLRLTMMWLRPKQKVPSYRTFRRVLFPFLVESCFPMSSIFTFPIGSNTAQAKVRIVPPTEWAILDVLTSSVYDSMFRENPEQREGHCGQYWAVEKCDNLRKKADLLQPTSAWCLNTVTGTSTVHNGQTIALNISSIPKHVSDDLAGLDYTISALDRGRFKLKGQIVHIWCAKVAGQLQEMETDKLIDLLPEQRMLVQQSLQLSPKCGTGEALNDDSGIRAGDICTLLDGSTSQSDWLCVLIHRFCNTQTGSSSRRLLWIRNESDYPRS